MASEVTHHFVPISEPPPPSTDKPGEATVGEVAVVAKAAQAALPVLKRQGSEVFAPLAPPDTPGFNCDTFVYYWSVIQLHVDKFVVDYPEVSMITALVCGILGLSLCLPQSMVALVVGLPLTGVGSSIAYTIYQRHEAFLTSFAKSLAKHVQALGQEGVDDCGIFVPAPPDNFGFNCETVQYFLQRIQAQIEKFVLEYPEVALITAIVCLILGLSFFLPSLFVIVITGIPVAGLGITIGYSIFQQYDKFMESFSRTLARHARAAMQEALRKTGGA